MDNFKALKIFLIGTANLVEYFSKNFKLKDPQQSIHQVCTDSSQAECLVFINLPLTSILKLISPKNRKRKKVLIRFEPKVVQPTNYIEKLTSKFDKIFDVGRFGDEQADVIFWPQDWNMVYENLGKKFSERKERIALVCGNKLSLIEGELYSLRRECINNIDLIDLYGTNWKINFREKISTLFFQICTSLLSFSWPKFSGLKGYFKEVENWHGSPESKFLTLSNYKYTLVIENSIDYLSEKLFDAFFSRTLPIYIGPDLEKYHIPRDLALQVKPKLCDIKDAIEQIKNTDYEKWNNNLTIWLNKQESISMHSSKNIISAIYISL